jgi:DNA (cytosine-5)-methyltransferase 1
VANVAERRIVDLFAGAGGWEEGLRELGWAAVGIDNDRWACSTARAAGHERVEADIAAVDPLDFAPAWGLIASPPCQAYSNAGKGLGKLDKPHVIACAHELAAGHDTRAEHLAACRDPRSLLTVEPLRWAVALRPRWIALEQVPPVLELWSLFCGLLAGHGYEATAGVLSAERYGVPQTRKRAFLIASLDGPAVLPEPTHRSYNPRRPDRVPEGESGLLPWVSMADALGWERDAVTHTNNQTNGGRRPRGLVRPASRPSRTIDSASGSWTVERGSAEKGGADG